MAKRSRTSPWTDPGTAYALAVVNGEQVTGRLVRLACERHLRDLERWHPDPNRRSDPQFRYLPEQGSRVEGFSEILKHFKGRWAGEPFLFSPWQQFQIYSLFGWQRLNERGRWVRRFRIAYNQVARKNGKTSWLAVLGNYLFIADGEAGGEIYTVATKLDQARIIHEAAIQTIRKCSSDKIRSQVRILKFNMHVLSTASKFEPLGSDSKTLDGLNPHGGLVDEYHAHPDSELYNVINTGMGARDQPLLCVITTAGDNLDSACGRERDYAIKVLEGTHTDETYFAYIAEPDPADDPGDEACWEKGNPNLGVSVDIDELRAEYNRAKEDPAKYGDFMRKRLDIWLETADSWIAFDAMERWWRSCAGPLPDLAGRICHGGLDLATIKDLTALALVFPPAKGSDRWSLVLRLWCPAVGLADRVRKDRVPYDMWLQRGWLKATDGNRIDYDVVKADILALGKQYKIQSVGYDPWNAEMLTQQLDAEGLGMVEMRQSFRDLSQPMKHLEAMILDGTLAHGDNEAFRWMLSNVATRTDDNGNIAPSKKKATERIDGVVAAIMALGRATRQEAQRRSRYEEEGAVMASFQL